MTEPVTQLDIDQRVLDLYDEYCHGRIDRREFLLRAARGGRRPGHGAGAAAALRGGADDLLHRHADQGPVRELSVARRQIGTDARLPGAARGHGAVPGGARDPREPRAQSLHRGRGAPRRGRGLPGARARRPVPGRAAIPATTTTAATLQAKLDQAKLRTDMLNSARFLKTHTLSTGKLGVDRLLLGRRHRSTSSRSTLGADLQAGAPFYGAAAETAGGAEDQGAAADPLRGERPAHQRDVARPSRPR